MDTKECVDCKKVKSLNDFYSYKKRNKKGREYIYYYPYCKECAVQRAYKWKESHLDSYYKSIKKRDSKPSEKIRRRELGRKRREQGKYREWLRKNKDKIQQYYKKKYKYRTHNISDEEWLQCKLYFDNSCAYCGLHIDNHYIKYKGQLKKSDLHKEHVDHNGANDLSNCVPACKSCNSEKNTYQLTEWYNENNPKFDINRLNKIQKWLNEDYKKYIKTK